MSYSAIRISDPLALADWRRRVAEFYAAVRAAPNPLAAWRFWRAERDCLIATHPQSPLPPARRARFDGLPFFDYDPTLRLTPDVVAPPDETVLDFDIGPDGRIPMQPFARTKGLAAALGGELTLYWIVGYGGGVFLPFADASLATYGGGRYLLDSIKGADLGTTDDARPILDFNFAYNPSCAYADGWVCPLPPAENHLPDPVRAGERMLG